MSLISFRQHSAWSPGNQQACPAVNVGTNERWLSAGAGVAALLGGARLGGATGLGLGLAGAGLLYRAASGYCRLHQALGVSTADPARPGVAAGAGELVCRLIDIDQPVAEVYRFWRNLENLRQFMQHLNSVKVSGDRSHWEAEGPLGVAVAWDAQIINKRANELLAWQSLPGSQVDTAGSVHFEALGERRTRIRVALKYSPPGGKAGIAVADLLGADASAMIEQDLRQLKHLLEARGPRAAQATSSGHQPA